MTSLWITWDTYRELLKVKGEDPESLPQIQDGFFVDANQVNALPFGYKALDVVGDNVLVCVSERAVGERARFERERELKFNPDEEGLGLG